MGWREVKKKVGVALGVDEDTAVTDAAEKVTREAAEKGRKEREDGK